MTVENIALGYIPRHGVHPAPEADPPAPAFPGSLRRTPAPAAAVTAARIIITAAAGTGITVTAAGIILAGGTAGGTAAGTTAATTRGDSYTATITAAAVITAIITTAAGTATGTITATTITLANLGLGTCTGHPDRLPVHGRHHGNTAGRATGRRRVIAAAAATRAVIVIILILTTHLSTSPTRKARQGAHAPRSRHHPASCGHAGQTG